MRYDTWQRICDLYGWPPDVGLTAEGGAEVAAGGAAGVRQGDVRGQGLR